MISRKWIAALARLRGGGAPASRTPGAEAQSRDRWDPPARGARLRGGGAPGSRTPRTEPQSRKIRFELASVDPNFKVILRNIKFIQKPNSENP